MIFGFCIGSAEYGDFIAVEAAMRATYASVLRKTVREIGQSAGGGIHWRCMWLHCTVACRRVYIITKFVIMRKSTCARAIVRNCCWR